CLGRHSGRQLRGDGGGRFLRTAQHGREPVRLPCRRIALRRCGGEASRRLVPARVSGYEQRLGELCPGSLAAGLLLRLGREPPRLRPKLREDVLDTRDVGLGFDELLLRLPSTPLVAPDAGDLLEQPASLL